MDLLHEGLDVVFLRDIAHIALDVLDAGLLVVGESALECCLVDVVEDDVLDTCCNECLCNVEANAVRCAGDPGVLTFQRK